MIDPFQRAEELGIPVYWGDPGEGNLGVWTGSHIILADDLNDREAPSVLAHELSHAINDHPYIHKYLSPRIEARADRDAAAMLIDHKEFLRLANIYPDDLGQVAYELGVTEEIARAYLYTCFSPETETRAA